MIRLRVDFPGDSEFRSYPIWIGARAISRLGAAVRRAGAYSRLHVVTDARVWAAGGRKLASALKRTRLPVSRTIIPSGEPSKSAEVLARVWSDLIRAGCDRRSLIVAFGGGVVGDLAGFAAASILRGIDFIQVPTTLLAMVDASVGGKTGINLPEGKNLVGAFHQPRAVVIDLDFLRTLPERELRAGWAEVIKTAAIRDAALWRFLENHGGRLRRRAPASLQRAIRACCRIKAEVVAGDERESGLRMVLNFGHTLAHAIEAARGYGSLLHGEAVAIGMTFASLLSESLGAARKGTAERLERLLRAYGLPTRIERCPIEPLLAAMQRDKKRGVRGLRWVFIPRIGSARIHDDVPMDAVRRELRKFLSGRPSTGRPSAH